MMNKIERTLFWFQDGDKKRTDLTNFTFGLSTLMNRLLNESYNGRKIKFINIDFSSEVTYRIYPAIPKDYIHYYSASGGHLRYYGVIDFEKFDTLGNIEKKAFLWTKAFEFLEKSAMDIKNDELLKASQYAFKKGIEIDLNEDYKLIESEIEIYGKVLVASIWVNFREDAMYSKLIIEKENKQVFEKNIDKADNGAAFFLEMYKAIEVNENNIIVKGDKDVTNLPLKIPINFEIPD